MSLKQKALLQTIGMFALVIVVSYVVTFILANVSAATIANAFGVGSIAFLAYMFYSVTLSRLEYNAKLKEMTEKKD
jgi:FtsH-binding integral membrane protein